MASKTAPSGHVAIIIATHSCLQARLVAPVMTAVVTIQEGFSNPPAARSREVSTAVAYACVESKTSHCMTEYFPPIFSLVYSRILA